MDENNKNGNVELSENTGELIRSYFAAFANLYGIIPLSRAFHIIKKQNPTLKIDESTFLAFADEIGKEEHYYIIAAAEDIYEGIDEPTPPMKREIIAEYLYAVDNFEGYEELKENQQGKPFYVPEKDTLLKYQDDLYFEETKESAELEKFLRSKLKLKKSNDILLELETGMHIGEEFDPQYVIYTMERLEGRDCFRSEEQLDEFFQHYFAVYNHLRIPENRGFTLCELREKTGDLPYFFNR